MPKIKHVSLPKANRSNLDSIEISRIPVERISDEEAAELAILSEETDKDGVSWKRLRAELGL
jgi:hypothetical protein